jgi:hypothetical protein
MPERQDIAFSYDGIDRPCLLQPAGGAAGPALGLPNDVAQRVPVLGILSRACSGP